MTGRENFRRFHKIINFLCTLFSVFGKKGNTILLRFFRNTNGKPGLLLRYILLKNTGGAVGNNVSIQPGVYLYNLPNLKIGNNVSIHPMCYLDAAGGITIGDNVSIAHSTTLISTNHTWNNREKPIKYNPETFAEIIIEDDVWIGCGVRVLANVKISGRSVVAAGAVINKSFANNSLIGGVPAKLIKTI